MFNVLEIGTAELYYVVLIVSLLPLATQSRVFLLLLLLLLLLLSLSLSLSVVLYLLTQFSNKVFYIVCLILTPLEYRSCLWLGVQLLALVVQNL